MEEVKKEGGGRRSAELRSGSGPSLLPSLSLSFSHSLTLADLFDSVQMIFLKSRKSRGGLREETNIPTLFFENPNDLLLCWIERRWQIFYDRTLTFIFIWLFSFYSSWLEASKRKLILTDGKKSETVVVFYSVSTFSGPVITMNRRWKSANSYLSIPLFIVWIVSMRLNVEGESSFKKKLKVKLFNFFLSRWI